MKSNDVIYDLENFGFSGLSEPWQERIYSASVRTDEDLSPDTGSSNSLQEKWLLLKRFM